MEDIIGSSWWGLEPHLDYWDESGLISPLCTESTVTGKIEAGKEDSHSEKFVNTHGAKRKVTVESLQFVTSYGAKRTVYRPKFVNAYGE